MERLTVKYGDGLYESVNPVDIYDNNYSEINYSELLTRLGHYEDLEEQGKMLKLPCAVGDTVYVKMQFGGYAEAEVRDFTHFTSCGFCIVVTSKSFDKQNIPFSEFGKTVFLTRQAEEDKLVEMEAGKEGDAEWR